MRFRPVRLRELAAHDLNVIVSYYYQDAGDVVALRSIEAFERSFDKISKSPNSGSLRFQYELDVPGLRVRTLDRFPYLVFYIVVGESIEVLRILHARRDIPSEFNGHL